MPDVQLGDLLYFTLGWSYGVSTPTMFNTFYYEVTEQPLDPSRLEDIYPAICARFYLEVVEPVCEVLSSFMTARNLLVENFSNGLDLFEYVPPTNIQGQVVAEPNPPINTWTFKLVRGTTATRNGYKRFPGVPETMVLNGKANMTLEDQEAVSAALYQDIDNTSVGDWGMVISPRIVGLGATGELRAKQRPISVAFNGLGSQVSRKGKY